MPDNSLTFTHVAQRVPPHLWFAVSAVFHYLGPSFAVMLFPAIGLLGVAWMRITFAALFFAGWSRPWTVIRTTDRRGRALLVALGLCLAVMNTSFYLALDRLPMSLVAAMEFAGVIAVAAYGMRTRRNAAALLLVILGVLILIDVKWVTDPIGLFWSGLNAVLFTLYIILGHKAAEYGASGGIGQLGAAMGLAALFVLPLGLEQAWTALASPLLVMAGIGVALCSSVIPYISDQMAMSRLPRASFALLLALLPASATLIAAVMLAQIPSLQDLGGVGLVMIGVALHRPSR